VGVSRALPNCERVAECHGAKRNGAERRGAAQMTGDIQYQIARAWRRTWNTLHQKIKKVG